MPKFRNTRTGRVVDVPNEAPTRRHRPKRDEQWVNKIAGMDRSRRWERVDGSQPDPVDTGEGESGDSGSDAATGPSPGEVRAWAKAEGIDVPARGKIPDELVEQYKAAQRDNDGW